MARQGELHAQINPSVSISRIETWSAMWAYEHGSRRSFYNEHSPEEGMVTARARERWRQQEMGWYRYYAALLDNQIVGGLYVSMWEDVPTLMGVYTLQTARRHGVATAAIARAIHDLLETGRDTYCLYVKEDNPAQQSVRFTWIPHTQHRGNVHLRRVMRVSHGTRFAATVYPASPPNNARKSPLKLRRKRRIASTSPSETGALSEVDSDNEVSDGPSPDATGGVKGGH